ncbi:unnamed protein product [Cladocopium goreaui]|uniref:Bifunctional lysine-specific demethylase and histidyl-hydroxylase n=1 Tax=Cladocopium goreaui TaxID=2562237 RepID=A0A9P1FW09_9DINO|nr:unnamed protein product [Cladocopium goreaui]
MPFVLECGELVAGRWTLEEQLRLLHHESYEVFQESSEEKRKPIQLTGYSRFTHPAIGQAKAHSFMADDQRDREATEASVRQGLEMGTWVISSGNSLSPHLARICEALQCSFQVPFVTTNVYISRLDSPITAPLHTDRFDSFIMQTEGAKRWRIFDTSAAVPRWPVLDAGMSDRGKAGDVLYLEQVGPLLLDECLKCGEVVYLPRGFPHATSTFDTSSLSTTSCYSTSLTVSLLLESVGLTMDKVMRCAAGIHEGRNQLGQCFGAEEILKATPQNELMRATLPIGFLARRVAPELQLARLSEGDEKLEELWVEGMVKEVQSLVKTCGLEPWLRHGGETGGNGRPGCPCRIKARWKSQAEEVEESLRRVLSYMWRALPRARQCCQERVYSTGKVLKEIGPDQRHEVEEKALVQFPFYPEEGIIYARSPSINSPVPVL